MQSHALRGTLHHTDTCRPIGWDDLHLLCLHHPPAARSKTYQFMYMRLMAAKALTGLDDVTIVPSD